MAHAFNDWNVVPEHSVRIYEALKGRVPLQAYFHQGGHGGAPPLEMMNKWFTRYLYGVENGVEREPKAWIVRETTPAPTPAPPSAAPAGGGRGRGRGADAAADAVRRLSESRGVAGDAPPRRGRRPRRRLDARPTRRGRARETLVDNVEFGGAGARDAPRRRRIGCSTRRRS